MPEKPARPSGEVGDRVEDQLVEGNRVAADSHAAGIVDRIGDRGAGAADAQLANALRL